ncbi:cytochrome P450 [Mycolicibacterium sp. XJ1819]
MTSQISELLDGFDQYNPDHVQVMHDVFEHARRECPVFHTSAEPGYWVVTRYSDAKRILLDTETFSNRNGVTVHGVSEPIPLPAASDPPLHKCYRDLLRPFFARDAFRAYESEIRTIARQLMEPWLHTGRVEFVNDYAAKLAYASLFAVFLQAKDSADVDLLVEGADRIVQESTQEAYSHLMGLVQQLLAKRRAQAEQIDDMLSAVDQGVIDGRPLNENEKLGLIFSAIAAGFETNYATMALIMHEVVQRPDLVASIEGPDWTGRSLSEFLRFTTPVTGLIRTVTRDTTIRDVELRAGDTVLISYASVDRDEEQFPQPDTLDFARLNSGQHMAFSYGVHRCLGAPFAEFVIGIGLDELTQRATNFQLQEGCEVTYTTGVVRRPEALPLTFELR